MSDDATTTLPNPVVPAPADPPKTTEDPGVLREKLTEANNEAGARRIELRDVKVELDSVKTQVQTVTDEKAAAIERATDAETSLLKLKVALNAGVPGDQAAEFSELLQGTTEDELKSFAEKIRKFSPSSTPPPATDPSQARGGDSPDSDLSPGGQWLKRTLESSVGR